MGKAVSALRSQEEALRRARRFVEKALARCRELGLEFVDSYMVGSRARGDYTVHGDTDLVLVLRNVKGRNVIERLELFKDVLEPGVELRVYDEEEWTDSKNLWIVEMRREAVKIDVNKTR